MRHHTVPYSIFELTQCESSNICIRVLERTNALAYYTVLSSDEEKSFVTLATEGGAANKTIDLAKSRGQYYKTFTTVTYTLV